MKSRTITRLHWGLIVFFSLLMLADGTAGVLRVPGGQEAMRHLGYPLYALLIFGTAKILGALALLQPWWRTLKEWAFAGFAINFVGRRLHTCWRATEPPRPYRLCSCWPCC
ncbi:MAG: DoxX family protein [Janthinobacterium lividum]